MFSDLIGGREPGTEGEWKDVGMGGKESWQKFVSNFDRIRISLYPGSFFFEAKWEVQCFHK